MPSLRRETSANRSLILRKALGPWDRGSDYIETVPKRGYRFAASVHEVMEERSCPRPPAAALPAVKETGKLLRSRKLIFGVFAAVIAVLLLGAIWMWRTARRAHSQVVVRSIAVLPLENLSGDPAEDYFADGMTDELITNVGQIGGLRVISRTSAMQYKGAHKPLPLIARELNVDAVVEGTVMRSGNQVRITAQLIEARADRHLWAQSYEGDLGNVLVLQRQVAGAIVEQIRTKLTPGERAVMTTARIVNPEAYEDYLRGHYLAQTGAIDGYEKSIGYFSQSIKKDPQSPLAYSGLADSYIALGHMVKMPPQRAFPTAQTAAMQALHIDDSLAEAHQAQANVKFLYDWDFPGAEREFRRAIELNPNSVTAHQYYADYLMAMGRVDESIAERKGNLQIDPLALRPVWALATGYYWARRYDEAIDQSRRAIQMDPNHWSGYLDLGLALEQKREFPEAMTALRKAVEVSNNQTWIAFIANDMALSGDRAGAEKIVADLQQLSKRTYISPWTIAIIYSGLGDKQRAFIWLEKCYQGREHDLVFSKAWPLFDSLRSDRRYQDLERRLGLP